ncbi:TIGR04222 domain-containing membrane protein [Streptomyces albireticuli]|uniref:TIGR04222 domain-containing membrane protein n=1 Tax=Streptomyces albireticuli TaxID=1940 RepID=UPI0036747985
MITIAVVVALLCLLLPSLRLSSLRRGARGPLAADAAGSRPDLPGVAYLLGGAEHVVDATVLKMYEDRRITLRKGRVTVVDPASHHAMERALLKRCSTDWSNSLRTLRREMREDPALEGIDRSLVGQGLLMAPATRRGWPRAALVQKAGLAVAAAVTVVLVFLPASYPLPFVLLAPALLGAALVARTCEPPKWRVPRTDHGERVARHLRYRGSWSVHTPELHPEGLAGVVAVRGPEALTDDELRAQFDQPAEKPALTPATTARGRGTSSSYASSSSASRSSASSGSSGSTSSASSSVSSSAIIVGASCGTGDSGDTSGSSDSGSSSSCSSSYSSCSSGSSCSSCSSGSSCS